MVALSRVGEAKNKEEREPSLAYDSLIKEDSILLIYVNVESSKYT